MRCAIITCPAERFTNGKPYPFCPEHVAQFAASSEGKHGRPSDMSDFRNRIWKEQCGAEATKKWESATEEQKLEWKKGGFGR